MMKSKVTWGLAWAGLALVLAVPSADFLTRQFGAPASTVVMTSDTKPVKTASTTPAAPAKTAVTTVKTDKGIKIVPAAPSANPNDPVEKYLSTGKPLPDYISDRDAPAAPVTTTKPASPAAPVIKQPVPAETQVASISQPAIALPRMPLPATARPRPLPVNPVPAATQPEPVVIVDEAAVTGAIPQDEFTGDLDGWDTESLRDYLERRGILEGSGNPPRSNATVTQRSSNGSNYDPNGFYLSDGPNTDRTVRETRRERILRMLEESEDDGFTLF